jgi:hypothetical protein
VASELFNKTQRTFDDLDLRGLASKALSECTRLALRYAKRAGKRDIDQTRIDDLLHRFVDELRRQRAENAPAASDSGGWDFSEKYARMCARTRETARRVQSRACD